MDMAIKPVISFMVNSKKGVQNMKKSHKSVLGFVSFAIIFALLLNTLSMVMIPKNNQMSKIIRGFYDEKKNSLDVLFLGDSSMYRSIIPAKIWEENGITSYALGAPAVRTYALYYLLEEALKTQKPKVVVMEVNCAFNNHSYSMGNKRKIIDNMKLSMNKMNMIQDPAFQFSLTDKLSLLFPIFLYHNRYNELNTVDIEQTFISKANDAKGFVTSNKRKPYKGNTNYMSAATTEIFDKNSKKYLDKIYELCKQNGIKLMLLKVPGAKEWNLSKKKHVEEYAVERHLPYLDLNDNMQQRIDWNLDTNDRGVHLNFFGAEKVTSELNRYFKKHYKLPKRADLDIVKSFDKAQRAYEEKKRLFMKKKPVRIETL